MVEGWEHNNLDNDFESLVDPGNVTPFGNAIRICLVITYDTSGFFCDLVWASVPVSLVIKPLPLQFVLNLALNLDPPLYRYCIIVSH